MNNAGTERVIMNLYKNIDKEKVQFDFLVNKEGELDQEIIRMGGKISYLKYIDKKDYFNKLLTFFSMNKYNIIHVHTHGNMLVVIKAAKESKVKCRIIHSHNSRQDLPKILKIFNLYRNIKIEKYATNFFACSKEAAKWLFPCKHKYAKIVYNAIDIDKYSFSEEIRKKVRSKLNIDDNEKVIMHVGRFARQKNHVKIIKIARKLVKKEKNIKFILIGTGPLEDNIKKKISKYNLQDKVMLLGNRKDVNELLMAGDLFLFPSLHEGLGIVVVEAQFSGLKCIVSTCVPEEADIKQGLVKKISLNKSNEYWSNEIIKELNNSNDRNFNKENSSCTNYNIKKIAKNMQEFYLKNI